MVGCRYVAAWVDTGRNLATPPVLLQLSPSERPPSPTLMDEANSLWQALVRTTKTAG